jgi:uncharacterized alkaline shock family protein YloU
MSAMLTEAPAQALVAQATEDRPAATRGRTLLQPRVLQRLAEQAATEVPHVLTDRGPRASAQIDDDGSGRVELTVGIGYPAPVRRTTDELRLHVMDTVQRLSGRRVVRLDIVVSELHAPLPPKRVL